MPPSITNTSQLPERVQAVLRRFIGEVRKTAEGQVEGIILYGSLVRGDYVAGRSNVNIFLLVKNFSHDFLTGCGKYQHRWSKQNIVTPLLMTEQELVTSSGLFPLEYLEIKECHLLLDGRDPFPGHPQNRRDRP